MSLLSKSRDRLLFCTSTWSLFLCDTGDFRLIRRKDGLVWYILGWLHLGIRPRRPKAAVASIPMKETRLLFEDPYFAVGLCPRWAWGWQRTGTEVNSLVIRLGWLRIWVDPQR